MPHPAGWATSHILSPRGGRCCVTWSRPAAAGPGCHQAGSGSGIQQNPGPVRPPAQAGGLLSWLRCKACTGVQAFRKTLQSSSHSAAEVRVCGAGLVQLWGLAGGPRQSNKPAQPYTCKTTDCCHAHVSSMRNMACTPISYSGTPTSRHTFPEIQAALLSPCELGADAVVAGMIGPLEAVALGGGLGHSSRQGGPPVHGPVHAVGSVPCVPERINAL